MFKESRRVEQILARRVDTSGRGEDMKKVCRRVKIMQIWCTHVHKWQNDTIQTTPGMWGIKENDRVNSSMLYLIHCKKFCKYKCYNAFPPNTLIKIYFTDKNF
jgi:hypothetical protein